LIVLDIPLGDGRSMSREMQIKRILVAAEETWHDAQKMIEE
jgi:hypothetical protein